MREKLISAVRTKTKKVQNDLLLARADLHETTSDLASSLEGVVQPTRETVAAVVEQNANVEAQLSDAVVELASVSELLRVAEARLEAVPEQTIPLVRAGDGHETLRAQVGLTPQTLTTAESDEEPAT